MDLDNTNKIYEEYAEIIAIKIFKHMNQDSNITLDDIRKKISIKQNKTVIDINNWYEATCLEDLLELKNKELKEILSNNSKTKTGTKKILAERVWKITHPEIPLVKPDLCKSNKELYHIDDSSSDTSDEEDDDIGDIIKHSSKIYINNNKIININESNNINKDEYVLVPKKSWVFKEFEHYYKFIGILKKNTVHSSIIPDELKQYYLHI